MMLKLGRIVMLVAAMSGLAAAMSPSEIQRTYKVPRPVAQKAAALLRKDSQPGLKIGFYVKPANPLGDKYLVVTRRQEVDKTYLKKTRLVNGDGRVLHTATKQAP